MYSEELEALIKSVVADGEYSAKEKRVLHKKAKELGIDIDELDVYVEGLAQIALNQLNAPKEETEQTPQQQPIMNEKTNNIKKCPNCGAPIEGSWVKCPECGYVFSNVEANSSAQKLAAQLAHCNLEEMKKIILHFPIPSSKDDLLEFLISLKTKKDLISNTVEDNALIPIYEAKYKEVCTKAQTLFPNDSELKGIINQENDIKDQIKNLIKRNKKAALICFGLVALWIGCLLWSFTDYVTDYIKESKMAAFESHIEQLIKEKKLDEAITYYRGFDRNSYSSSTKTLALALIEAGRPNEAQDICEHKWRLKEELGDKLINSYISIKDYDNARILYRKIHYNRDYINIEKKIVISLCEEGKIDDAKKYAKKVSLEWPKASRKEVEKDFAEIIKSYK